jgi:hydrogenase small subunit
MGCSEPGFYDNFPLYDHLAHIPGTAMPFEADKLGKWITGVTAAGVALHGAATGIIKRVDREPRKDEEGGE